jgi:multidrug efflux system membrane fusion protein
MNPASESKLGQRIGAALSILIVAAAMVLGAVVNHRVNRYPRTDDAEIVANFIGIAPQVEGPILRLQVHDNQFVKQGDLLFEIDDRPYRYALEKALSRRSSRLISTTRSATSAT